MLPQNLYFVFDKKPRETTYFAALFNHTSNELPVYQISNAYFVYSQVPNKCPPCLINFLIFFQSPGPYKDPPFINFKKIEFITGLLCYFLSFLKLFTPNFQCKLTCFCVYFGFTLCDNLFLFFPLLYNNFKPFLEFRPPCLLHFGSLSNPPDYWDPPVYLALESTNTILIHFSTIWC